MPRTFDYVGVSPYTTGVMEVVNWPSRIENVGCPELLPEEAEIGDMLQVQHLNRGVMVYTELMGFMPLLTTRWIMTELGWRRIVGSSLKAGSLDKEIYVVGFKL